LKAKSFHLSEMISRMKGHSVSYILSDFRLKIRVLKFFLNFPEALPVKNEPKNIPQECCQWRPFESSPI
jgi:hypothetical protein